MQNSPTYGPHHQVKFESEGGIRAQEGMTESVYYILGRACRPDLVRNLRTNEGSQRERLRQATSAGFCLAISAKTKKPRRLYQGYQRTCQVGESDIDSIEEICVTPEQIKKRMDAVQRTLGNLAQQITTLQGQVAASAGLQ